MLNQSDSDSLIKYRLEQADETVSDVKLLIDNGRLRSAVNQGYYAMFYALLALAISKKFESSKQAKLIGWFNKNFIHSKSIDTKYGKMLNKAFNRRTKGDYDTFVDFELKAVQEMYEEMNAFITMIKSYLNV